MVLTNVSETVVYLSFISHNVVGSAKMGPPDDPDAVVNHELKVKEILEPFSKTAVIIKYDISLWFSWVIEV